MKAIIGVKAAKNRGKSSTIFRVAEILKGMPFVFWNNCNIVVSNSKECSCSFIWDGCNIGLFSEGDSVEAVRNNLRKADNCDIVVIALHDGESEKLIEKSSDSYFVVTPCYKHNWLINSAMANSSDEDIEIAVSANAVQIISLIVQLKNKMK